MTYPIISTRWPRPVWPHLLGIATFAVATQFGVAGTSLKELGLSVGSALLILVATVLCRSFNLRVFVIRGGRARLRNLPAVLQRVVLKWRAPFREETTVALNVGGVLVPLALSVYAVFHAPLPPALLWIAAIVVAGVVQIVRYRVMRGTLVRPFVLLAPAVALLLGWAFGAEQRAAFAYVSGFVGILAGADLLEFGDLRNIGVADVLVGNDASFDAIFLNQLTSLLFC